MIKSIHFRNFKALRDATLPLGPFTLIVGPNGSGKSTAMQAFSFVHHPSQYDYGRIVTAGLPQPSDVEVELTHDLNDYLTRSPISAVLHHPDWQDEDPRPPEDEPGSLHDEEADVNYRSPFE